VLEGHPENQVNTACVFNVLKALKSGFNQVCFPVFSDPTAENPWFGLRAMRNRPPTLVEASRQDR
jgi:hypothetical protein